MYFCAAYLLFFTFVCRCYLFDGNLVYFSRGGGLCTYTCVSRVGSRAFGGVFVLFCVLVLFSRKTLPYLSLSSFISGNGFVATQCGKYSSSQEGYNQCYRLFCPQWGGWQALVKPTTRRLYRIYTPFQVLRSLPKRLWFVTYIYIYILPRPPAPTDCTVLCCCVTVWCFWNAVANKVVNADSDAKSKETPLIAIMDGVFADFNKWDRKWQEEACVYKCIQVLVFIYMTGVFFLQASGRNVFFVVIFLNINQTTFFLLFFSFLFLCFSPSCFSDRTSFLLCSLGSAWLGEF